MPKPQKVKCRFAKYVWSWENTDNTGGIIREIDLRRPIIEVIGASPMLCT